MRYGLIRCSVASIRCDVLVCCDSTRAGGLLLRKYEGYPFSSLIAMAVSTGSGGEEAGLCATFLQLFLPSTSLTIEMVQPR